MNMMTVEQIAAKWNLSPRTVQNLCKNHRIPGAVNFGKSWMIPEDSCRPADGRRKKTAQDKEEMKMNQPLIRKSPFLDMTDLYSVPGTAEKCIENLADYPEAQALFEAEIAYRRGEIDKVYEHANEILERHTGFYAIISGGMLLALCAMWKGDIQMWYKAKKYLLEAPCKDDIDRDILALTFASTDSAIRDTKDFPGWFSHGCFDNLPKDAHPAARVYYIKHLLISAQELAIGNLKLDEVQGFGLMKTLPYIMEPMISQMVVDKVVMAEIYLRLLCAIAYHQYGDDEHGSVHLDKAIRLCLADGLYGSLVEHRRQLGKFLDDRLAMIDPAALKKVKELHKGFQEGWTKLHNAILERAVSVNLTIREREVARLAAYGLSDKKIGGQLGLSESSVKTMIRSAKNKTNVEKRSELALYV